MTIESILSKLYDEGSINIFLKQNIKGIKNILDTISTYYKAAQMQTTSVYGDINQEKAGLILEEIKSKIDGFLSVVLPKPMINVYSLTDGKKHIESGYYISSEKRIAIHHHCIEVFAVILAHEYAHFVIDSKSLQWCDSAKEGFARGIELNISAMLAEERKNPCFLFRCLKGILHDLNNAYGGLLNENKQKWQSLSAHSKGTALFILLEKEFGAELYKGLINQQGF